jgi:hypothetical protein
MGDRNDDEGAGNVQDANDEGTVAVLSESTSHAGTTAGSSSSSQEQQQLPQQQQQTRQLSQIDLLNTLGIPMNVAATILANPTGLPPESFNAFQSLGVLPGTVQNNPQISSTIVMGIQQLLGQLSENLARTGLDASPLATGNAFFPNAFAAQQQQHILQQQQQQQQPQQQPRIDSVDPRQMTSDRVSSVASSPTPAVLSTHATSSFQATSPAISASQTPIESKKPPPPIHPGAVKGPSRDGQPDYTTIPCRARGMPSDHNSQVWISIICLRTTRHALVVDCFFKIFFCPKSGFVTSLSLFNILQTAYFVVPNNIAHGENLICSYKDCAALGVKFCYCVHCGIPVAKRNFRQRHDHGQKKGRQLLQKAVAAAAASLKQQDESAQSSSTGVLPQIQKPPEEAPKDVNATGSSAKATAKPRAETTEANKRNDEEDSSSTHSYSMSSIDEEHAAYGQDNAQHHRSNVIRGKTGRKVWSSGTVSEEREKRWKSLLYDRPEERNEDDMSQWLLSVLQVSDPATSLPSTSSSNGNNESSGAANNGSASTNNGSTSTSNGDSGSGGSRESRESRAESNSSCHSSDDRPPSSLTAKRKSTEGLDASPGPDKRPKKQESPDQPV